MPVNLREERRRRGKSLRAMAAEISAAAEAPLSYRVLQSAEKGVTPTPRNQLALANFYGFDLLEQWPEPEPTEEVAA